MSEVRRADGAGLPIEHQTALRELARLLPGAELWFDGTPEEAGSRLVILYRATRCAVMWGNLLIAGPEVVALAMAWRVERRSAEDREPSAWR